MMSCTIDVKENRYVVVTDIPCAFLHADMEGDVHMLLEGTIIIKLDPKLYRKYIWWIKNDRPMLYVRLKKALYGTLQAALLFWRLLSDTLKKCGFKLNEYNKCIANRTINGQQCNIIWLVDKLKILHAERKLIEDIIAQLNNKFGKESPLTTACGKVLEYLRMMLDYSTKVIIKYQSTNTSINCSVSYLWR